MLGEATLLDRANAGSSLKLYLRQVLEASAKCGTASEPDSEPSRFSADQELKKGAVSLEKGHARVGTPMFVRIGKVESE